MLKYPSFSQGKAPLPVSFFSLSMHLSLYLLFTHRLLHKMQHKYIKVWFLILVFFPSCVYVCVCEYVKLSAEIFFKH